MGSIYTCARIYGVLSSYLEGNLSGVKAPLLETGKEASSRSMERDGRRASRAKAESVRQSLVDSQVKTFREFSRVCSASRIRCSYYNSPMFELYKFFANSEIV